MSRRNVIWIILVAVLAAVMLLVWRQQSPDSPLRQRDEFAPVGEAYRAIRNHYYRPLPPEQLCRKAIEGMVGNLDRYSTYLPADQADLLQSRLAGRTAGVGLIVQPTGQKGQFRILDVDTGSPAQQANLQVADRILSASLLDDDQSEVVLDEWPRRLQPDQTLQLTVQTGDEDTPRTVNLTSRVYPIDTVLPLARGLQDDQPDKPSWLLPDWLGRSTEAVPVLPAGLAYVRIREFCPQTVSRLRDLLGSLEPLRGVIVDLRQTPGGLLSDAVAAADLFLDTGLIVAVKGRGQTVETHRAHADSPWGTLPLVVLVGPQTASAAEVFAGAMRLNSRALLIGRPTRGKHCIQSVVELGNDLGVLNLTTAEFFFAPDPPVTTRPSQDDMPIRPDIQAVCDDPDAMQAWRASLIRQLPPADYPAWEKQVDPRSQRRGTLLNVLAADKPLQVAIDWLGRPGEYRRHLDRLAEQRRTSARKARPTAP
jgi:carboxyl-terminal processing protease